MPRLSNLKDWGYGEYDYYEVSRVGFRNTREIQIELDDFDKAHQRLVTFGTIDPDDAGRRRRQAFTIILLLCLPALSFVVFHLLYLREGTQVGHINLSEIRPLEWLTGQ